jgi:hypothetical protein
MNTQRSKFLPALLCSALTLAACSKGPAETTKAPQAAETAKAPASAPVASTGAPAQQLTGETKAVAPAAAQPAAPSAPVKGQVQTPPKPIVPNPAEGQNWPKNGRLEVDKPDHDFGQRFEGEVLVHTFKLKSAGEGPLHISTAKPTCGCTVTQLEVVADGKKQLYNFGDPIPPGTEVEMTAQLDTKAKHSAASSKINIHCNDPRGTVTVGLVTALDTYFLVAPALLDFGDVPLGSTAQKSFEVIGKKPDPFKLTLESKTAPEGVAVALEPLEPNAEGMSNRWKATVSLSETAREGALVHPVGLVSDQLIQGARPNADGSPAAYTASAMTRGMIRGPVNVDQQYLGFGLIRPGQVASRTVKLTSFDQGFQFGPLETSLTGANEQVREFKWAKYFSATTRPSEDGKSVQVELTCNGLPEEAEGSWSGQLVIQTGHPKKPEMRVTFSGILRAGQTKPVGAATAPGGAAPLPVPAQPAGGG